MFKRLFAQIGMLFSSNLCAGNLEPIHLVACPPDRMTSEDRNYNHHLYPSTSADLIPAEFVRVCLPLVQFVSVNTYRVSFSTIKGQNTTVSLSVCVGRDRQVSWSVGNPSLSAVLESCLPQKQTASRHLAPKDAGVGLTISVV